MSKSQSLQDPYLNTLRKERVPVSVFLVNGIKLQGHIESFDNFVLLLRNNNAQMVYKHAISTIVPSRNIHVPSLFNDEVDTVAEKTSIDATQAAPKSDPFYA